MLLALSPFGLCRPTGTNSMKGQMSFPLTLVVGYIVVYMSKGLRLLVLLLAVFGFVFSIFRKKKKKRRRKNSARK
jgi:hypothetical protein